MPHYKVNLIRHDDLYKISVSFKKYGWLCFRNIFLMIHIRISIKKYFIHVCEEINSDRFSQTNVPLIKICDCYQTRQRKERHSIFFILNNVEERCIYAFNGIEIFEKF